MQAAGSLDGRVRHGCPSDHPRHRRAHALHASPPAPRPHEPNPYTPTCPRAESIHPPGCSLVRWACPRNSARLSTDPDRRRPLLAFSGAFPTTILYCVMPPLAVMSLRRRAADAHPSTSSAASDDNARGPPSLAPPDLLPGGSAARVGLALLATAFVCTSAADIGRRVLLPLLAR